MPLNEQELNKKLAEWAGLKHLDYDIVPITGEKRQDDCRVEPNYDKQTVGHWSFNPPDFTESLDACIKWLAPKLGMWEINHYNDDKKYSAWVSLGYDGWNTAELDGKTPALAFCSAIEKLITLVSKESEVALH